MSQQKQSSLLIWFELYDAATGHRYKNTGASSILRSSLVVPVVDQFREAVYQKNSKKLSSFDASDLLVYKNKDSFDKRNAGQGQEQPLEEDSLVDDFGKSKKEALIVVVQNVRYEQDFPRFQFNPSDVKVIFPFFLSREEENVLTLLERDEVLLQINKCTLADPLNPSTLSRTKRPKFNPIIISTSRGMGKTFFLKKIGKQKVKPELKNILIDEAGTCGRILSFDFAIERDAILNVDDVKTFFPRLMIYYLCLLFDGTQVDGINFQKIRSFSNVTPFVGRQPRFNEWKSKFCCTRTGHMIEEYIRLTNIAFCVDPQSRRSSTPPVFLLDEIQCLCAETHIPSSSFKNRRHMHTLLSWLLNQLASSQYQPICICTGTNNGNILGIHENSSYVPRVLSLTPLRNDYWQYWTEMTEFYNSIINSAIKFEENDNLIMSLVYASYQIPRLLFLAHEVWYYSKLHRRSMENLEDHIMNFRSIALGYYKEMAEVWTHYSVPDLAHIVLCCGVRWRVLNTSSCVPGTEIEWSSLIQQSIIFPHDDQCYLFPFMLVWKSGDSNVRSDVEDYCRRLVPGLDISDLFFSFDYICRLNLYHLGMAYEKLFAGSLATMYYLKTLNPASTNRPFVPFLNLYLIAQGENDTAAKLLSQLEVNFSQGIVHPMEEVFADQQDLPCAVIHNQPHHNAHHDILLFSNRGLVPVSVKASFTYESGQMAQQILLAKGSNVKVNLLIWLYLGKLKKEEKQDNVAFLDGSGVCNGNSFDKFVLVKKLKSQNNQL